MINEKLYCHNDEFTFIGEPINISTIENIRPITELEQKNKIKERIEYNEIINLTNNIVEKMDKKYLPKKKILKKYRKNDWHRYYIYCYSCECFVQKRNETHHKTTKKHKKHMNGKEILFKYYENINEILKVPQYEK